MKSRPISTAPPGAWLAVRAAMQIRFDRGTIVIAGAHGPVDPATLPGTVWDPRVRVWRAPADAHAAIVARLGSAVRVPRASVGDDGGVEGGWTMPELRW